jgi:hypothetical protein
MKAPPGFDLNDSSFRIFSGNIGFHNHLGKSAECHHGVLTKDFLRGRHEGVPNVSGRLRVRMDDGSEDEFGPGEVSLLPPGHDAWMVGIEAVVVIAYHGHGDLRKTDLRANLLVIGAKASLSVCNLFRGPSR